MKMGKSGGEYVSNWGNSYSSFVRELKEACHE
jgi:hypothetical protein